MLSGPGLVLKGGASDGSVRLRPSANVLEVDCCTTIRGNLIASGPGAPLIALTTATVSGRESRRRLEFGQFLDYFPGVQASLPMGAEWRPVQFVVNAAGGGLWLPASGEIWNGLSVATKVCNTRLAFECAGDAALLGNVAAPGIAAASYSSDAEAEGAGLYVGAFYSNNGTVQVRVA